jgi:hypothetical protein
VAHEPRFFVFAPSFFSERYAFMTQLSVYQKSIVLPALYAAADDLPPKRPRDKNRIGEIAEACFVVKAENLNFAVAKPWSVRNRYDFIVDSGKRLFRVQLKCTDSITERAYQIKAVCSIYGKGARAYTAEEIDFIVAYIVPRDIWYVIPIAKIEGKTNLRFHPDSPSKRRHRWEVYREAWHLLSDPA